MLSIRHVAPNTVKACEATDPPRTSSVSPMSRTTTPDSRSGSHSQILASAGSVGDASLAPVERRLFRLRGTRVYTTVNT